MFTHVCFRCTYSVKCFYVINQKRWNVVRVHIQVLDYHTVSNAFAISIKRMGGTLCRTVYNQQSVLYKYFSNILLWIPLEMVVVHWSCSEILKSGTLHINLVHTVTAFNSCTKCVGSPGILHDRLLPRSLGMDATTCL